MKKQLNGWLQLEIFLLSPAVVPLLVLVLPMSSLFVWNGLWDLLARSLASWVLAIIPALLTATSSYFVRKLLLPYQKLISTTIWLGVTLVVGFFVYTSFMSLVLDRANRAKEMGSKLGLMATLVACIIILILEFRINSTQSSS